MQFKVICGKHTRILDGPTDFQQAGRAFLREILTEEPEPKLGEVIHVSCVSTEAYLDSSDLLRPIDTEQTMRIHEEH